MNKEFQQLTQEIREQRETIESVESNTEITGNVSFDQKEELVKLRSGIGKVFGKLLGSFNGLSKILEGNDLKELEDQKELLAVLSKKDEETPKAQTEDKEEKESLFDSLGDLGFVGIAGLVLGGFAILPGLISGLLAGLLTSISKDLPKILKRAGLGKLGARIRLFFTNISKFFTGTGKNINGIFSSIGKTFDGIKDTVKNSKLVKGFQSAIKGIKGFFRPITDGVKDIKKTLAPLKGLFSGGGGGALAKIIGPMKSFFSPLNTFITTFKKSAGIFIKLGASIGRIAGRFLLPVTIIMGVIDGVKGFIEGFKESDGESILARITDGLSGALGEIIGNLVGVPLDLLKSAVGWILGKFGFENAQEILEGFSFKDLLKNIITGIGDFVSGVVDFVVKLFTNPKEAFGQIASAVGNVGDMAGKLLKSILRAILPKKDDGAKWFNPMNLAHKAIPKSVYEFAGIRKDGSPLVPPGYNADTMITESDLAGTEGMSASEIIAKRNEEDIANLSPIQRRMAIRRQQQKQMLLAHNNNQGANMAAMKSETDNVNARKNGSSNIVDASSQVVDNSSRSSSVTVAPPPHTDRPLVNPSYGYGF